MKAQCRKLQQRQQQQHRSQQRSGAPHPHAASATTSETSSDLASQVAQITEQLHAMQHAMQSGSSAMSAASGIASTSWILDSGATHHMTADATSLVDLSPVHPSSTVRTVDGTLLPITQCGHLLSTSLTLPTVHHVPGLALNLVSVSQLTDHGLTVTFSSSACFVQDHLSGRRIGTGRRVGGLYHLEHLRLPASDSISGCVLLLLLPYVLSIAGIVVWVICLVIA